jgi:peptide/nickel transport system substrate-binding protein
MLKRKSWLLTLCLMLLLGVLAACSSKKDETKPTTGKTEDTSSKPKDGGTVTGAMDTAPKGVFNPIFYSDAYESNILSFTHEGLVSQNDKLEFIPNLAKSWEFNKDHTALTFKLQENVKWQDGQPFTANDVVFTYKTMSSPGYIEAGGVRTDFVDRLLGYDDFSTGKTKDFQGVTADDDHTVTFHYKEPNVLALAKASFSIIPEHIFKNIPIKDMPSAPESRQSGKVIGTGPFKLSEMVEGEQYVLKRNDDYWKGKPHLDSVVWKIVDGSVILGLLEKGEIDFVADPNGFQAADYDTVKAMGNVNIIEQPGFGYQLMGMEVNHRAKGDATLDPSKWTENKNLSNVKVRQAIAYAIDRKAIIQGLLFGRASITNSPIASQFWAYDSKNPPQYQFSEKKAKQLLDEAGYKDVDGDKFREDPQGKKWVLNLNYPAGNKIRERSAPIIKEMLEKVGIKVEMRQPKETAAYYDDLEKNSQDWDLYLAGWTLDSTDPDPTGMWNATAAYNYSRWNNPEADKILQESSAPPKAFDQAFRKQKLSEWQVKFGEDLPALILYNPNSLWAYNKRLEGVKVLPYQFVNEPEKWWVSK